jgi:hypothetical protein
MVATIENLEILGPVVPSLTVAVMDVLVAAQPTTQDFLHHRAMFVVVTLGTGFLMPRRIAKHVPLRPVENRSSLGPVVWHVKGLAL